MFFAEQVRGDYILSVQVHSYDNPSSRCAGCTAAQGCCDLGRTFNCGSLCDNEFLYCLRPLGTLSQSLEAIGDTEDERSLETRAATLQCMESPAAVRTQEDTDAAHRVSRDRQPHHVCGHHGEVGGEKLVLSYSAAKVQVHEVL